MRSPAQAVLAPTAPRWVRTAARPLVRGWLRLDVEGADHVPAAGPVLLAPHHRSHADVLAVGAACPRPVTYLGSDHLARVPVIGRALPHLGMLTVSRGARDTEALARCLEVLAAGGVMVIFPEGSRSRDGRVYRPRSGVPRLAALAGCPVVPVGLVGTERAWPIGARPRLAGAPVTVRFGLPLPPPQDTPADRRRFASALHDRLVALTGAPRADGLLRREVA